MDTNPPSGQPPGSDPLLPPAAGRRVEHRGPGDQGSRPRDTPRPGRGRSPRRHPARNARALALTASVIATGAVAAGLAYSEGAWSADDPAADGRSEASPGVADRSLAATPDETTIETTIDTAIDTVTPETVGPVAATTPSTAAPTTAPETAPPTDATSPSAAYADGVYSGTAEHTEWGDVQVQVTIADGAIVDVAALEYPTGRRSSSINDRAIPMLEASAVALQSADLDVVSGATYTSWTYADSLQAALDQAALAAAQDVAS